MENVRTQVATASAAAAAAAAAEEEEEEPYFVETPLPSVVSGARECLGPMKAFVDAREAELLAAAKAVAAAERAAAAAAIESEGKGEGKGEGQGEAKGEAKGAAAGEEEGEGADEEHPRISVLVQYIGKNIMDLQHRGTDKIIEVKRKVEKVTSSANVRGVNPREQIMFFRGKQLDNQMSLDEAGVTEKAVVQLVVFGTVVQAWYEGDDFENKNLGIEHRWLAGKIVSVDDEGRCKVRYVGEEDWGPRVCWGVL